jgi:mRNA interferase RelE/StbE
VKRGVIWSDESQANLSRLDRAVARRVAESTLRFGETSYGDVKKLKGKVAQYRLRVGDYRVIFAIDDGRNEIVVLRIGHRREIYDR